MFESRLEIRVEWGHCDPARIVYNPNFFDWMERGMQALFSAAGIDFGELLAEDPNLRGVPLVRSEADFLAPAKLDDRVIVASRIARFGRTSFDIAHDFFISEERIVAAKQTRVWSGVDPETGQLTALPIPSTVRNALARNRTASIRYETRIMAEGTP